MPQETRPNSLTHLLKRSDDIFESLGSQYFRLPWNVIGTRKTADYLIDVNRGINSYEKNQQNREGKKMTMHEA